VHPSNVNLQIWTTFWVPARGFCSICHAATSAASQRSPGAGHGFNAAASAYQAVGGYLSATGSIDAIIGGYERRRDDNGVAEEATQQRVFRARASP